MEASTWLGCAALLSLATPAIAFQGASAPAQSTPAAAARDPDAMAALDRMGAALRRLQSFGLHVDVTTEEVLTTGQKIQNSGTVEYRVRAPNGLRIEMVSDKQARTIYYDGRNVTLFAPRVGYYASFAAPATIRETVRVARERYGVETPLADLFMWGTDPEATARVTSAFRVGDETIGGQVCEQYAMRQQGVDWQVWIRRGDNALPCKLVITSTDDPSMPQYTALMTWRPDQTFADSDFAFTPPANARQIQFSQVQPQN